MKNIPHTPFFFFKWRLFSSWWHFLLIRTNCSKMHCSLPRVTTCAYCCRLFFFFPGTEVIIMLQCSRTPKKTSHKHLFMLSRGHHYFWTHTGWGPGAETNASWSVLTPGIPTLSSGTRAILCPARATYRDQPRRSRPHRKARVRALSSSSFWVKAQFSLLLAEARAAEKRCWFFHVLFFFFFQGPGKKHGNGSCFTSKPRLRLHKENLCTFYFWFRGFTCSF